MHDTAAMGYDTLGGLNDLPDSEQTLDLTLAEQPALEGDESSVFLVAETDFDGLIRASSDPASEISVDGLEMVKPGPTATPTDVFIHGVDQLRRKLWFEAADSMRSVIESDSRRVELHTPRAFACLGYAYLKLSQTEKSIAAYRESVQLCPDLLGACSGLAAALMSAGHDEEAVQAFHAACRVDPDRVQLRFNLGNILARTGHKAEAEQEYKHVLRLEPMHASTLNNLGALLAKRRRFDEAIELLTSIEDSDQWTWRPRFNLGLVLAKAHRWDESIACLQSVMRDFPACARTRILAARTMRCHRQHLDAIEVLDEFLDWGDLKATAQELLGLIHDDLGNPVQAMVFWRESLETDPGFARVYSHIARRCLREREFAEAEIAIAKSLALSGQRAESWTLRGQIDLAGDRIEEAIQSFEHALSLNDHAYEARYWLGRAHLRAGSVVGALGQYERLDAAGSPLAARLHKRLR
ncbi:MAG: tetratricopeptide repeat protein [Phycisphaerales bacterium]|nr:tetratricopeptide repeat protein [Phycisphaerales bacterium]